MANWLAGFAGLGTAAKGLPEGLVTGQKLDQQQRQLDELARHRKVLEDSQSTDLGALSKLLGLPLGGAQGTRVPTSLAPTLVTHARGEQERQRKLGEREGLASWMEQQGAGTPAVYGEEEGGAYAPGVPSDPKFATAARFARAGAGLDTLWKTLYPDHDKPQIVGENAQGVYTPGKGLEPFPRPPAEPFTPPEGYVPSFTIDARGRRSTTYKPPEAPKPARTLIERYAAEHGVPITQAEQDLSAARARGAAGSRPMDASDKQVMNALSTTLASIKEFQGFSPEEIQRYTGMAQSLGHSVVSGLRAVPGLGETLFGPPDERFERYRALMGRFQAGMFQEGGKQLTGIEKRVAEQYTPTGREPGGAAQIRAKLQNLEAFTRLAMRVRAELSRTGRADIDPLELEQIMETELSNAGFMTEGPPAPSGRAPEGPGPATTTGSGHDILRRANAVAQERYGTAYGNLDEPTRRAIFQEVTGGR